MAATLLKNRVRGKLNHEKGVRLEDDFCAYLVNTVGWENAKTRAQMLSDNSNRGINVDIIA